MVFSKENKAKILIIDDEEDICIYLKSILERTGKFNVLASMSPTDGLNLAKSFHPDLILLDIVMSGMDGTVVAEHLAKDESTKDILVAFVSVLAKANEVDESGMIGKHHFIAKPIAKDELVARIESLLQGAYSHR